MHLCANHIIGTVRYEPLEKAQELYEEIYPTAKNRILFECVRKKVIGKPCEGKPHARFDEGVVSEISLPYSTSEIAPHYENYFLIHIFSYSHNIF